jgi:PAS domain S-box-containing protein
MDDFNLHRAIVAQSPDAIIFADVTGTIRVWNKAAEQLFGHTAAEAVGQTLDIIIPERFREAHWRGFHHAVANGATRSGGRALTTRSAHKDGGKLYVDVSFGLVKDPSGAVIGALAVGRSAYRNEGGNSGSACGPSGD